VLIIEVFQAGDLFTVLRSIAPQGLPNGSERFLLRREPEGVLLRNEVLPHPHRKLTSLAFYQFRLDPDLFRDERCHTGGAGEIISDFAVSNANALHVF
jgi:hypothetical protein